MKSSATPSDEDVRAWRDAWWDGPFQEAKNQLCDEVLRLRSETPSWFAAKCKECGFEYREHHGHIIPCPVCALKNAAPQGGGSQSADESTERGNGHARVPPSEPPISTVPADAACSTRTEKR